jgi:hypothetical protein
MAAAGPLPAVDDAASVAPDDAEAAVAADAEAAAVSVDASSLLDLAIIANQPSERLVATAPEPDDDSGGTGSSQGGQAAGGTGSSRGGHVAGGSAPAPGAPSGLTILYAELYRLRQEVLKAQQEARKHVAGGGFFDWTDFANKKATDPVTRGPTEDNLQYHRRLTYQRDALGLLNLAAETTNNAVLTEVKPGDMSSLDTALAARGALPHVAHHAGRHGLQSSRAAQAVGTGHASTDQSWEDRLESLEARTASAKGRPEAESRAILEDRLGRARERSKAAANAMLSATTGEEEARFALSQKEITREQYDTIVREAAEDRKAAREEARESSAAIRELERVLYDIPYGDHADSDARSHLPKFGPEYDAKAGPVTDPNEEIAELEAEIDHQRRTLHDAEEESHGVIDAMEKGPKKSETELDVLATKRDLLGDKIAALRESTDTHLARLADLRAE